jgi:hypothetical protein
MTIESAEDAYAVLSPNGPIDYEQSFGLAKYCAALLRDSEREAQGRDIIIRALDARDRFPEQSAFLWNDLVEVSGLYPYVEPKTLSGSGRVRYEFHRAAHLPEIYFHSEQAQLASELRSGRSVVASAPTSFGKSLVIDEIVASKRYRNLVIIQPTLALLDETRKRFKRFEEDYRVVLSTSQFPSSDKGNLFLFTAERVVEYEHFAAVDFFVIDEFYKLSLDREDDRAITLNQAFYKLLKHTKQFYLLGPSVRSIPTESESGLSYHWFASNFATVATDEIALAHSLRKNTEEKRNLLFVTLAGLKEPTIIYCAAPTGATQLAKQYGDWMTLQQTRGWNVSDEVAAMCEWIGENISPEWCLYRLLQQGVAFHHGALPRHLGSAIVDAFNNGGIRYLFCTSTLIEGVNTTAKSVILFDKKKGVRPIDYFDFRNIAGRSGRMLEHYVGHVYKFEDTPEQLDLHVDFPILTQRDAPTELLMSIDDTDLKEEGRARIAQYEAMEPELRDVIRSNPAVSIDGQLKIVELITQHEAEWHHLLSWRSFPNYEQLLKVLELAWHNLRRPKESKGGVVSPQQLTMLTVQYAALKSIRALIRSQLAQSYWIQQHPIVADRVDAVVFQVLSVTRHWFDYKLPAFLGTVSNLQRYVYERSGRRHGDYSSYAAQIENGFLDQRFSDLSEYGVPRSAIAKIAEHVTETESVDALLVRLRRENLETFGFNRYELAKVKQAF